MLLLWTVRSLHSPLMSLDGDGPWELDVDGFEIKDVTSSVSCLEITMSAVEENDFRIKLEGRFEFHNPTGETQGLDPHSSGALAALSELRGDTIRVAQITSGSELHIEFASGHALYCACDGPHETWNINAPDGIFVVSVPGADAPAISDNAPKNRVTYRGGRKFRSDGTEITYP